MTEQLDIFSMPDRPTNVVTSVETPVDLSGVPPERVSALMKVLDVVFYDVGSAGAFRSTIDIWWAVLDRFSPDGERHYMESIDGMSRKTLDAVSRGFGELLLHFCYEGRFADLLGVVYMGVGSSWGKSAMGQYFTPWNICMMMTQMQMPSRGSDEGLRLLEGGEPVTVSDPACGSGAMLLAFKGAVAQEFGRPALRNVKAYGQDIDHVCATMARIQMRLTDDFYMSNYLMATMGELEQAGAGRRECSADGIQEVHG